MMVQLFNPNDFKKKQSPSHQQNILTLTINYFESLGKQKIKSDDHGQIWYGDFLDFIAKNEIFSKLLTPKPYALDAQSVGWDTWQICQFNQILSFYGLSYWYTWQVTQLGLGPIWMGTNQAQKKNAALALKNGAIAAFGLSEKEHGADLYSTEMKLIPDGNGGYLARGKKYYIGNANKAKLISTFGKIDGTDQFVFFLVSSDHPKFSCIQNVIHSQNYVAEFELLDYPIAQEQILSVGQEAWDCALNTINVCKFNLGWASIGMCTHAFYEAINHASSRVLFNQKVTEFVHVKKLFMDAYCRLVAMQIFSSRAVDYMRSASLEDRRYLLFNPIVKMKVTSQGEKVIDLLWDVIAAKGFEKNMIFESVARDIRALPKLEGTVHVNMALIIKFIKNYFFKSKKLARIRTMTDPGNDDFLFNQGQTKGLSKISFHDYRMTYNLIDTPNIKIFKKQIKAFKALLLLASPSKEQVKDFDFLLTLGELFTLVVYGQLIIEGVIEKST